MTIICCRISKLAISGIVLFALTTAVQAQRIYVLPHGTGGTWNVYQQFTSQTNWNTANTNVTGAANPAGGAVAGNLVRIDNAGENAAIFRIIQGEADAYIGANDKTTEGTWRWATPTSVDGDQFWSGFGSGSGGVPVGGLYSNWNGTGEPNGTSEDVAEMRQGDGFWNDISESNSRDYVGEWQTNATDKPHVTATSASIDPLSGNYYERLTDDMTWDQSRVAATSREVLGAEGHLVVIGGADENNAAHYLGGTGDKWIGFHDSDQISPIDGTNLGGTEGTFQTVNGEAVGFTNFGAGEPNNSGGEDAANIRNDGMWNDHQAGQSLGQGGQRYDSIVEYAVEHDPNRTFFDYLERRPSASLNGGNVNSLAAAKTLLALPTGDAGIAGEASAQVYAISFFDPDQTNTTETGVVRQPFLTDTTSADDDFAVRATALLDVETAGDYTFAIFHDDNVELTIDGNTQASSGCCGGPTFLTYNLAEGALPLELFFFEDGGGANLQLFSAPGILSSFDLNNFGLVGDPFGGGLGLFAAAAVPEPSSIALWSLLGLVAMGITWRRMRRN